MMMFYLQIIVLIFAAILIAACAPASTPTPLLATFRSPVLATGTPGSPPVASPSPQATYAATDVPTSQPAAGETQIRVIIGDAVLTGRLWDNATARDLIAQLPRKLSMDGVPAGDDPFPRDIGYYNPSGDLVFYYDDVGYFAGIVRIGQFDGSMDAIVSQTGNFTARIELAN